MTGRGRLTDKAVNTLQNYYGLAIRGNKGDLYAMKKAVAAILFHCSEGGDDVVRHQYCPRSAGSWCKYQVNQINGTNKHRNKINIPAAIRDIIKPVFSHTDLGSDALLEACLDGETQNVNEALNGLIWKRCPKDVFVGKVVLDIAVGSAITWFNDGALGLIDIFSKIGLIPGTFCIDGLLTEDKARISEMNKKTKSQSKKRRKKLRAIRKGFDDKNFEEEGEVYAPGAF